MTPEDLMIEKLADTAKIVDITSVLLRQVEFYEQCKENFGKTKEEKNIIDQQEKLLRMYCKIFAEAGKQAFPDSKFNPAGLGFIDETLEQYEFKMVVRRKETE